LIEIALSQTPEFIASGQVMFVMKLNNKLEDNRIHLGAHKGRAVIVNG